MSERAKELWDQFLRYTREAYREWADSVEDSPPSHVYSAILGALIVKALGLFL